jgi:FkbH-like protein
LLLAEDVRFWPALAARTAIATTFEELLTLAMLRKKARARGLAPAGDAPSLRVAVVGGYTFSPFKDLLELLLAANGVQPSLLVGDFDNHVEELLSSSSLAEFDPDVVLVWPPLSRCRYAGPLTDARELVEAEAKRQAEELLAHCRIAHQRLGAELVLVNFPLPAHHDLGPARTRYLASDWSFRKLVNLQLGLAAPPAVHICDAEFLAARAGGLHAEDARLWFESKQAGSTRYIVDVAREACHVIVGLKRAQHKVLVLDLDNTMWGGVIGDVGVDGIDLGGTSPRGEAFRAFQSYVLQLQQRGVLLAVASKNDHERAIEPFRSHPEMVIRESHVVSFKANWGPKSDSLRAIASELNLGLDSLVFVDDNPAEIDIVRQFAPEVKTILLGEDPSTYVAQLQNCRYFEPRNLTAEDLERTSQYQAEARRQADLASATDMPTYLRSLEMRATISRFNSVDLQRIVQLINKSNQFNLTTRRRTEADVQALIDDPRFCPFTIRLEDRFGDHGLIAIVIGHVDGDVFDIDTWLMSCRVLQRQVEEETLNEIVRLARDRRCAKVRGVFLPTAKNGMVKRLLPNLGFATVVESEARDEHQLAVSSYERKPTFIQLQERR